MADQTSLSLAHASVKSLRKPAGGTGCKLDASQHGITCLFARRTMDRGRPHILEDQHRHGQASAGMCSGHRKWDRRPKLHW